MKNWKMMIIGLLVGSFLNLAMVYGWFYMTHPTGSVYVVQDGRLISLDPDMEAVKTVSSVVKELERHQIQIPRNSWLSIDQGYEQFIDGDLDLTYHEGIDSGDVFVTRLSFKTKENGHWATAADHYGNAGIKVAGGSTTFSQRKDTALEAVSVLAQRIK